MLCIFVILRDITLFKLFFSLPRMLFSSVFYYHPPSSTKHDVGISTHQIINERNFDNNIWKTPTVNGHFLCDIIFKSDQRERERER